ncbi:uncharacterized protein LOC116261985 [Nymphaea colorata]|uniref:uncharacterized protein LOC116261985 n=1 Tax=Nymphaea colorata TaxID=210225 RepID=UPI00129E8EF1|nr:uncharacterized protein LOC116261985 [Nymphaea colorata]
MSYEEKRLILAERPVCNYIATKSQTPLLPELLEVDKSHLFFDDCVLQRDNTLSFLLVSKNLKLQCARYLSLTLWKESRFSSCRPLVLMKDGHVDMRGGSCRLQRVEEMTDSFFLRHYCYSYIPAVQKATWQRLMRKKGLLTIQVFTDAKRKKKQKSIKC